MRSAAVRPVLVARYPSTEKATGLPSTGDGTDRPGTVGEIDASDLPYMDVSVEGLPESGLPQQDKANYSSKRQLVSLSEADMKEAA